MRRLVVILGLLSLLAPASALAMRDAPASDGTLVVRNAGGDDVSQPVVQLRGFNGAAVGQVDRGSVLIADLTPFDSSSPDIFGGKGSCDTSGTSTVCQAAGTAIRFRAIGTKYRIKISGFGIDLNVIGSGTVTLSGSSFTGINDGRYSLNGGDWQKMPTYLSFPLTPVG